MRVVRRAVVLLALGVSACAGGGAQYGTRTSLSCVPYAREVSGIRLQGDAWEWWAEAAGRYERSDRPMPAAVLVFRRHGDMRDGHLAVVSRVVRPDEIMVTHSNWLPGRIDSDQPVVDVSAAHDWSLVRVWWPPVGALGRREYPTDGFILPQVAQTASR
ncbi:MAG TPA: CHAP domain-containing protein [Acetobacteraceae bacterium]|nr:CHAP domain-containing protein [Acetobacteraceae bacterium]